MMEDARARARHSIRSLYWRRSYLAAVDVLHGELAKQKIHVILRLEAADELRIVQPSKQAKHKLRYIARNSTESRQKNH